MHCRVIARNSARDDDGAGVVLHHGDRNIDSAGTVADAGHRGRHAESGVRRTRAGQFTVPRRRTQHLGCR